MNYRQLQMSEHSFPSQISNVGACNTYLHANLDQSLGFTNALYNFDDQILIVSFTVSLTNDQLTSVQSILSQYTDPPAMSETYSKSSGIVTMKFPNTDFTTAFVFQYPGSGDILYGCTFVAGLVPNTPDDSSTPSFAYHVRVMNVNTNQLLGDISCTNSIAAQTEILFSQDPSITSNIWPHTLIELQIQKDSAGCYVLLQSLNWLFSPSIHTS